MKSLLVTPLSRWSLKKLRALSIDPADMHCQRRQGCYLLVASGTENDKQIVELYVGSSENMALRYQRHVNLIEKCGARMQHFHWRCLQLDDTTPLFIPLSYDSTCDNDTLRFRESMHIAFIGSWGRTMSVKNIQREAWSIVRNMRLPGKEERLPEGWRGANREIP